MKMLVLVGVLGCGGGGNSTIDAASAEAGVSDAPASDASIDAGPTMPIALTAPCSRPLGSDGAPDFPATATDQTTYREVTVENHGATALSAIAVSIDGADSTAFSVFIDPETQTPCGISQSGGLDVKPGEGCRLEVTFQPTTVGPKSATLHVTWTGGGRDIPLHATATAPVPFEANKPDVFIQYDGITIPDAGSLEIFNRTAAAVSLGDLVVADPFTASWNCPSPLLAGSACTVHVGYDITKMPFTCPTGMLTTTAGSIHIPLAASTVQSSLSLDVSTREHAIVKASPGGDDCPMPTNTGPYPLCGWTFPLGTQVTLTAVLNGDHFIGWSSGSVHTGLPECGTDPTCTFQLTTPRNLVATFAPAAWPTIAVTIVGKGSVLMNGTICDASCSLYVPPNQGVTMSEFTSGTFDGWTGDCSGNGNCNLGNVISDRHVTATFTP